jgi:hypothetical protein
VELSRLEKPLLVPAGDIVVNVRLRGAHAALLIPSMRFADGLTGDFLSRGLGTPQLVQFTTKALDRKASEDAEEAC